MTQLQIPPRRNMSPRQQEQQQTSQYHNRPMELAKFLGWFSVGVGAAKFIAPRCMAKLSGLNQPALVQSCGVRDVITGIGVLNSSKPSAWLWARVAGDLLNLGTLATAAVDQQEEEDRGKALVAAAAVAGVMGLNVLAAKQLCAQDRRIMDAR